MKVERSNFILVSNSALSTNVFLQSKCNMHDRYDHASWSWYSCIALLERFGNPDSLLSMPDFDLTGELSLKIELHMLRPITEKVHSGNGPVSLVLFLHFGTLKVRYQLICLLCSARTNQLGHFDLLLKDYWNLLVLILSRPVSAPFILLLRPFGIRFQTASVTYIRFLSSKSNLKLIFFVRLFWIHRCNLFVFIVCALWVLLKIVRLIRTLHYYYYYYIARSYSPFDVLKEQHACWMNTYFKISLQMYRAFFKQ